MSQTQKEKKVFRGSVGMIIFMIAVFMISAYVSADEHDTVYNGTDYARVYDYDFYTSSVHPELAGKSDAAVLKYFVKNGIPAGEQAISTFSVKSFRNSNQDLRKNYGMDYEKYVAYYLKKGYRENRTATGSDDAILDPVTSYNGKKYQHVYDFNYYLSKYPTLKKKYTLDDFGAIEYFVNKGMKKRHQASENFNVNWFYNANAELRYKYGQNWSKYYLYYQKKGYRKGTVVPCNELKDVINYYSYKGKKYNLSAIYNFEYYTKHNKAAYKYWKNQDDAGAVNHFVNTGMFMNLRASEKKGPNSWKYKRLRRQIHPNLDNNAYIKANQYSSRKPWLVLVNQGAHMVYVFKGKKGAWRCVNKFPCVVGKPSTPTPVGTFCMGAKGLYFDPTEGGGRCWYYSAIYGPFLFHSVIYARESAPLHITDGTMSASVSHGCVRLSLSNAKWMMETVPSGTTIVIYNRPW